MMVSKMAGVIQVLTSVDKALEKSSQQSLVTISELCLTILNLFLRLDLIGA